MSNTSGHKTYVTFPIIHMQFDHNRPNGIRNILLQNSNEPKRPDHCHFKAYNCKCDILQLKEDVLRQRNDDDLKGSMCSVCFANLNVYTEKLSR